MKSKMLGLMAVGLLAVPIGSANAVAYNFFYESTVIATLETSGGTTFSLEFVEAPDGSGAKINDLLMLNTGGATLLNTTFTAISESPTASYNAAGYEGQDWNWKISFPTGGPPGTNLFNPGDIASWSIITSSVLDWDFGQLHINAFLNGESIKLGACVDGTDGCGSSSGGSSNGTPVPEPASSLVLLGLGLLGLGFNRRLRKAA